MQISECELNGLPVLVPKHFLVLLGTIATSFLENTRPHVYKGFESVEYIVFSVGGQ